jgi:hypothetical protein
MNKQILIQKLNNAKIYILNNTVMILAALGLLLCGYGIVGTGTRVDKIKALAPAEIDARGWDIMRYEGFQWGSFSTHGGRVWYHVRNKENHNIQYRVFITMWDNELHYHYGAPEKLDRISVEISK